MSDQFLHYLLIATSIVTAITILTPPVGNFVSAVLRAVGKPDAARKVDAWIPGAVGAMTEAKKIADGAIVLVHKDPPAPPPDPPSDTTPKGLGPALLALSFVLLVGCGSATAALNAPIVAVNESEKTLTEANTTLAQIEGRQLTDAINAAPDAIAAHVSKDAIAKKFHAAWVAYDKTRASWVIAKIAVAEYESVEASGGLTDLPKVLAATAELAADYKALVAALKEIAQ